MSVIRVVEHGGKVYFPFGESAQEGPCDVERINGFKLYEIGKKLAQISQHEGEVSPGDVVFDLFEWSNIVKELLDGDPFPVGFSAARATDLKSRMDDIIQQHAFFTNESGERKFRFPKKDDPAIPSWVWTQLRTSLSEFETVLRDEMREAATYYVPRRGIYLTSALVDSADDCFPSEVRGHVPPKTCDDWKAAGRCLAFNLCTASGFHAARAVEGTLEAYYQTFSGKPGKTLRSWDDYIKALQKIRDEGADPSPTAKTLSELDQMRTFDRNPIMHPRIVLTESDARILFGSSESLIIAMAQEIKGVKTAAGVQPELSLVKPKENGKDGEAA